MFCGNHLYAVDEKGRVAIPARFRDELSALQDGRLVVTRFKRRDRPCLDVLPVSEWNRFQEQLAQKGRVDTASQSNVAQQRQALEQLQDELMRHQAAVSEREERLAEQGQELQRREGQLQSLQHELERQRVTYTMDGDERPANRFYTVEFTNPKGGMVGIQGIMTERGWPSLDHGLCIDRDRT